MTDPSYTPTAWRNGSVPPINQDNLNKIEQALVAYLARLLVSVRFDAGQGLSPSQQAIARANLGINATVQSIQGRTPDPATGDIDLSQVFAPALLANLLLLDVDTLASGLAAALTDAAGHVAMGVRIDGGLNLGDMQLYRLPPGSPYVYAVTGSLGQLLLGIRTDGTVEFKPHFADGSVGLSTLSSDVKAGLAVPLSSDDHAFAVTDPAGRASELAIGLDGNVPTSVLARWKTRMGIGATAQTVTYNVYGDGSGDYVDPWAAVAAITAAGDSGPSKQYEVVIHPGIYSGTPDLQPPAFTTLRGTDRDKCELRLWQPDNSDDTTITNNSCVRVWDTCSLINLKITGKNCRYAVHAEAAGAAIDAVHTVLNCHIEHYGNQAARDWRTANPGSGLLASNVWGVENAWGYGSSSGIYERFENVTFISTNNAWYVHDNQDFAKPINHDLINCRLIARQSNSSIGIQPLGSGQSSRVNIDSCEISALCIAESDAPWITQNPANQVSNHSQIRTTLSGKQPVGFISSNRGTALRITSASTGATSTVRVSGTAATAIFGPAGLETARDGGGGLKGYCYGYWDISGILVGLFSNIAVNNTLGKRLGNCATTPKTLTVTVDGGAPINITFNTDLTSASNSSIIATINAALGAAAVADEYNVSQGETYATFPDRQLTLTNTGTTGIPRWAPVKRGTDGRCIQLMTTSDPVSAFVGVALEPIPPGAIGRILTSGLLYSDGTYTQFAGIAPAGLTVGTPIYLSDTVDGQFATSGTRQVATGYALGWARFEGNPL